MRLGEWHARVLKDLGFPQKKTEPGDFYSKNDEEEWVLGGTLVPEVSLIMPDHLRENSTWLPTNEDLLLWLGDNSESLTMFCLQEYYPPTFFIDAVVRNTVIKGECFSADGALFDCIIKVLLFNNNQPYTKGYVRKFLKKRLEAERASRPPLVDDEEE